MPDDIKDESRKHDCPIGGISLTVLSKEEADREDMEGIMTEKELVQKIAQYLSDNLVFHSTHGGLGLYGLGRSPKKMAYEILALIKEAGYVRLSEDQTLPMVAMPDAQYVVQALLEAGWQRVLLEEGLEK